MLPSISGKDREALCSPSMLTWSIAFMHVPFALRLKPLGRSSLLPLRGIRHHWLASLKKSMNSRSWGGKLCISETLIGYPQPRGLTCRRLFVAQELQLSMLSKATWRPRNRRRSFVDLNVIDSLLSKRVRNPESANEEGSQSEALIR